MQVRFYQKQRGISACWGQDEISLIWRIMPFSCLNYSNMSKISDLFTNNNWSPQSKSRVFKVLSWFVGVIGLLVVVSILSPTALNIILNVLRVVSIGVVSIFFVLGILVIIGLRKEATRVLDILLEGSLTFIDFIEFLKILYRRFLEMLKEFFLYITPVLSYITAAIIYILLLVLYKTIGRSYDVTLFTIVITIILVTSVALLNKNKSEEEAVTYAKKVASIYKKYFIDAFEVVLLVFFLTIDSTRLFFLPENLNVGILAKFKDYDLMLRGFTANHLSLTINIVTVAIVSEIIRYSMRITALAKRYYATILEPRRIIRIKLAVRMAFGNAKDDIVRFITFTTVLFSVFLIFPRLKLLSLAVTSLTNLVIDLFIPERLVISRGKDLMNRVINKVFRL